MLYTGIYPDSQHGTHRRSRSVRGMRRLCPPFLHPWTRLKLRASNGRVLTPRSDHMTTPTPEEIAKMATASAGSETVKTITDLRFEQLEAKLNARIDELMKINDELRAANKELYAVASAATAAAKPATAAEAAPQPSAAVPVGQPDPAVVAAEQKAKDDRLLAGVISEMGYHAKKSEPDTTTTKDGM